MSDDDNAKASTLGAICDKAIGAIREQFPAGTVLVLCAGTTDGTGDNANVIGFSSTITPISTCALIGWVSTDLLCRMTRGEYDTSNTPETKKEETPK